MIDSINEKEGSWRSMSDLGKYMVVWRFLNREERGKRQVGGISILIFYFVDLVKILSPKIIRNYDFYLNYLSF